MKGTTEILKALADGTRLQILLLLSRQEMAVCELIAALKLSQPAVSHHLKILKHARLVKDNREGKWIFYTIDERNFSAHARLLAEFFATVQANLEKGVQASPIRTRPCLCEELQAKAGIRKRDDALVNS
ncbi:MAG: metalloregulator ArsR/SmtB family transcription factor [Armatimonadetes bacterium]|nr:metalloregulator ArsR/SmtB family transcription factor [Armatimonadota bacterium]